MKSRALSFCCAILLGLVFSADARAFLAHGPIELSIDLVVSSIEGRVSSACRVQSVVGRSDRSRLILGFIDDQSPPPKDWVEIYPSVFCVHDPNDNIAQDFENSQEAGFRMASIDFRAQVIEQMENERVLSVEVSFGFAPSDKSSEAKQVLAFEAQRKAFFSEDGEAYIPIQSIPDEGLHALGVQNVFIRLTASVRKEAKDSIYGKVMVLSDGETAEVLLDGAVVGKILPDEDMNIDLVSAGLKEIALRYESGKVVRKFVRVVAGRTSPVNFFHKRGSEEKRIFGLESLGKNEFGFPEYRRNIDGGIVVRIPEGEFLMGNEDTERSPLEHQVYLSAFLMDKMGVSWKQYKQFAAETGTPLPPHEPYWGIIDDHPAVYVTWEEAQNYCEWAGGRLPTEAEREKAARGTDGRDFPWGDEKPNKRLAVFRTSWGYGSTGAVGAHSAGASPYGLLNMGGNVWEWCSDWYDGEYYAVSPYRDPQGPAIGQGHVVRGGSWDSRPDVLSASCRSWGHRGYRDGDFGFRCAMNVRQ